MRSLFKFSEKVSAIFLPTVLHFKYLRFARQEKSGRGFSKREQMSWYRFSVDMSSHLCRFDLQQNLPVLVYVHQTIHNNVVGYSDVHKNIFYVLAFTDFDLSQQHMYIQSSRITPL